MLDVEITRTKYMVICSSVHFLVGKETILLTLHSPEPSVLLCCVWFLEDKLLLVATEETQYVNELLHGRFWNVVANHRIKL